MHTAALTPLFLAAAPEIEAQRIHGRSVLRAACFVLRLAAIKAKQRRDPWIFPG